MENTTRENRVSVQTLILILSKEEAHSIVDATLPYMFFIHVFASREEIMKLIHERIDVLHGLKDARDEALSSTEQMEAKVYEANRRLILHCKGLGNLLSCFTPQK